MKRSKGVKCRLPKNNNQGTKSTHISHTHSQRVETETFKNNDRTQITCTTVRDQQESGVMRRGRTSSAKSSPCKRKSRDCSSSTVLNARMRQGRPMRGIDPARLTAVGFERMRSYPPNFGTRTKKNNQRLKVLRILIASGETQALG